MWCVCEYTSSQSTTKWQIHYISSNSVRLHALYPVGVYLKLMRASNVCSVQQTAIMTQIRNFIDTHQVVCTGPFVYAYVEEVY